MLVILACLFVLVKGETFISVSRNYIIVETKTLSPYVDDEVAIIVNENNHNEIETTMIDMSSGSTFKHTSSDPEFIACSTINKLSVCVHKV